MPRRTSRAGDKMARTEPGGAHSGGSDKIAQAGNALRYLGIRAAAQRDSAICLLFSKRNIVRFLCRSLPRAGPFLRIVFRLRHDCQARTEEKERERKLILAKCARGHKASPRRGNYVEPRALCTLVRAPHHVSLWRSRRLLYELLLVITKHRCMMTR